MEFSTQEYWSGLPFPSAGDLPNPRAEPVFPASPASQADSLPLRLHGYKLSLTYFVHHASPVPGIVPAR